MQKPFRAQPPARARIIETGILRVWGGATIFPLLAGAIGFIAFHNGIFLVFCLIIAAIYAALGWATWQNFMHYSLWANATITALRMTGRGAEDEHRDQPITALPGMTGFDRSGFGSN